MFQTPIEVTQGQLRELRVAMVEALEESVTLFPLFDERGSCRYLLIDTAGRVNRDRSPFEPDCLFAVDDFPMDIRAGKAIYARPMTNVIPVPTLPGEYLADLWFMDPWERVSLHPALPPDTLDYLRSKNLARLRLDGERIDDICYGLDLRRVTGATARKSFFHRRRLEFPALLNFLEYATPVEETP